MRLLALIAVILLLATPATAEEACVKYHKCVPLDQFRCDDISRSSLIYRVCYAEPKRYMIVWLGKAHTPYHYCEIGPEVVAEFMAAPSMGIYFNKKIAGTTRKNGPFDCREHPIPTL
jgi:hypothetical protein